MEKRHGGRCGCGLFRKGIRDAVISGGEEEPAPSAGDNRARELGRCGGEGLERANRDQGQIERLG